MFANPWAEPAGQDRSNLVRRDLEVARRAAEQAALTLPGLSKEITKFIAALGAIQKHLATAPESWRLIRAFVVVDVPAVLQALEGLPDIEEGPSRNELKQSLAQAMTRADHYLRTLNEARARELGVGLDVLPALGAPADQQPTTGLMSGLTRRAQAVTKSAGALTGGALNLTSEVTSRASAAASGITRLSGAYLGDASRAVARPVTIRISALSDALAQGSMSALVFGGLASLIFPPLAPFLVGEAILSMPDTYAARLAGLNEAEAREELERAGERKDQITQIMAALKAGPVRFDTPCLSITMDPRTGKASGIVLQGRYTGHVLEEIEAREIIRMRDKAPDEETRRALNAWIERG
jgi:hypothetical protein